MANFKADVLVAVTTDETLSNLLFIAPLKNLPLVMDVHDACAVRVLAEFNAGVQTALIHGSRRPVVGSLVRVCVTPLAHTGWTAYYAEPRTDSRA